MTARHDGSDIDAVLAQLGPLARAHAPLGALTTYRVGGHAAAFVEAADEADLLAVAAAVAGTDIPVLVVGRGSNLLVADAGFAGVAVRLGEGFAQVRVDGTRVTAGAAVALPVLARRTVQERLTGFEWAVGVPGSLGGAVRMNAGGHGSDISAVLASARVLDLRAAVVEERPVAALDLGYRRSRLRDDEVVTAATLALAPGDRAAGESVLGEVVRWRRDNQPGGQNAGSVFTNPPGDSAGRLVEAAGLKGHRLGSAFVSPKHANFFQADEGGSADDVRALIEEVRRVVTERFGVDLVPELRFVGFGP